MTDRRAIPLLDFFDRARADQAGVHPGFGKDKVISFVGTSGAAGLPPALAARRLLAVEPDEASGAMAVRFAGALPRALATGESVAVSIIDVPGYRGYQLKSPAAAAVGPAARAISAVAGATRVTCAHAYTVRAEPAAASFFERIPFGAVEEVARAVRHALVAVGAQANISPRFVYHWELAPEGVALFHGDAFLNKTFYNVQKNCLATQLVVDLDRFEGYSLDTRIEEADPKRDAGAIEKISSSFAAAGFRASRVYRVVATDWRRVTPTA